MATEYLGVKQVAERLGITSGGLLNLKLPEPDAMIGRTRGWLPETIDGWNAKRLPLGKVFSRFGCFPLREAHQTWVVVCLAGVQIQSDVFFVFEMFGGVPFGELRGGHVRRFGGRCIGVRVLRAGLGCS